MKEQIRTGVTILLSVPGLIIDSTAEQIRKNKTAPANVARIPQSGTAVLLAESNRNVIYDNVARGQESQFLIGLSIVVHTGADNLNNRPAGQAEARETSSEIGFASSPEKKIAEK